MPESFGVVAPFYDVLMAEVPYEMWVRYYLDLVEMYGGKPHDLLDVCCGTGTVAELLTVIGYHLEGFDLNPAMIDKAVYKAAKKGLNIAYHVADATSFDLNKQFDGAYSFFDSLNYITTLEGFRQAIAQVKKHLKPGALFVFDLNTKYAFEQRMFDQRDLRKSAPVRYLWKGDYDRAERIIKVDMTFWYQEQELYETHIQRAHSPQEVEEALADAGFEFVACYQSYRFVIPTKRTDRVHYVCRA